MEYKVISSSVLYPETKEIGSKQNPSYKVLDTAVNLKWLLDHFNAEIKYNLMTRRREINIPGHFISREDCDNSALNRVTYLATINDMPIKTLDEHLSEISFLNSYHPIVECIKNNPWDKVKRLDNFIETIKAKNPVSAKNLIRTWMIAAIAAAHSENGFTNHGALVLQGEQGIGKTAWVKSLDPINCGAIKDGAILDPESKDCIISLSQYWIVEIGELDATFKKAIARLKSFITSFIDSIRLPYARKEQKRPRRSVYIATVNDSNYLLDDTGNRRWWTIEAISINYDHGFDMKQVWAEAYQEWKDGAIPYLSTDLQKSVDEANKEHERIDPLTEKLLSFYDWSSPPRKWRTCTQILEELGYKNLTRADATRIGTLLKQINGVHGKRANGITKHEIPIHIQTN